MIALDTSMAIPLLVRNHNDHERAHRWLGDRDATLSGHAAIETYSVLTRMPKHSLPDPAAAARVMRERFSPPLTLSSAAMKRAVHDLAERGIAGGAVYDALVALAAVENSCPLATLDRRASNTYSILGVEVLAVP